MSKTLFTAQELTDFYQTVADGDEAEYRIDCTNKLWFGTCASPNLSSARQNWRIKPAKKVIDLSVLIDSQIDCEFRDDIGERTNIGKLLEIKDDDWDMYPYITGNSADKYYEQCQPRMNHIHAWQGGECPLPEGFVVKVWFRSGGDTTVTIPSGLYWGANSETMAFEVLGLADGYVFPWEQDNE
jgi:hypothetical protein